MGFHDRPYSGQEPRPPAAMSRLRSGSIVVWLLGINCAVFLIDGVLSGSARGGDLAPRVWGNFNIQQAFNEWQLWRLFTYQFLHADLFHLLFNMIALYFFGPLMERWWGSRRFLGFYLFCGMCGAVIYSLLAFVPNLLNTSASTPLVGASGSIYGILIGCAVLYPHQRVMLLIPPIPMSLRTLAIILMAVILLSLISGSQNAGGEAAHLGGAILGYILVRFPALLNPLAGGGGGRRGPSRQERAQKREQEKRQSENAGIDKILEKVHREGLHSLTRKEKQLLQKATENRRDPRD
ncbi:MAG: rhomboid family intramembrane serine protease [Phycisphaerae bacterium]|nr:rhomboid family intramembrane serine protease [Phycisphaerae bacterium]